MITIKLKARTIVYTIVTLTLMSPVVAAGFVWYWIVNAWNFGVAIADLICKYYEGGSGE